jgi:Fungal Zn(2)-Cys(6) binuclear cluster domain
MRACEGCRRRKIKCDAATTNTWPCSACNRLKLQCVPPTMIDQDFSASDHVLDPQETSSYHFVNSNEQTTDPNQKQSLEYDSRPLYGHLQNNRQVYPTTMAMAPYSADAQFFSPEVHPRSYDGLYSATDSNALELTHSSQSYYTPVMAPVARSTSETSEQGSSTAEGLSEALGELKIDESGTGMQFFQICP